MKVLCDYGVKIEEKCNVVIYDNGMNDGKIMYGYCEDHRPNGSGNTPNSRLLDYDSPRKTVFVVPPKRVLVNDINGKCLTKQGVRTEQFLKKGFWK